MLKLIKVLIFYKYSVIILSDYFTAYQPFVSLFRAETFFGIVIIIFFSFLFFVSKYYINNFLEMTIFPDTSYYLTHSWWIREQMDSHLSQSYLMVRKRMYDLISRISNSASLFFTPPAHPQRNYIITINV